MKPEAIDPPLRAASCFSGIGAPELGGPQFNWLWHAEIEKFPAAVMAARFPDSTNLGDVTADDFLQRASAFGPLDMLVGGPPCFTAGHMVLTERGYIPIETVQPGDKVVTHAGRLRTVLRTGSKRAAVGHMSMVGLTGGITCTPDHRFLTRFWRSQNTRRNGDYARVVTIKEPEWVAASEAVGLQWLGLTAFDVECEDDQPSPRISVEQTMFLAGLYLGDGWIRRHKGRNKKEIVLGLGAAKLKSLRPFLSGIRHYESPERTVTKVIICDTAFAAWLEANFGSGAASKRIPAWALSHPHRSLIFDGYIATDGARTASGCKSNSVSRALSFGVAALGQTLGYAASINEVKTPDTCVIEGRTVNQRDYWECHLYRAETSKKSRTADSHILRSISGWQDAGEQTVYDIEVEEDNSFILDGAIVHNCQDFSVAGLRAGVAGDRGNLSLRFMEIAHAIRPRNLLVENVPGWLNMPDNAFGCFLGALVGADDALRSPLDGKWPSAGMVAGPRARAAWRVFDAQYFGVAQRRRRVFVVADFGEGADPAAVLFERKGVSGNSPPRREAGQGTAGTISARTQGGGGLGTDFEIDGGLTAISTFDRQSSGEYGDAPIASTDSARDYKGASDLIAQSLRGEGFDASEDGTGRGTPIVPVAFTTEQTPKSNVDCALTLTKQSPTGGGQIQSVAVPVAIQAGALRENPNSGPDGIGVQSDIAYTIEARAEVQAVATAWQVRRLTPTECARLQGFPDDHCAIEYRGKPAADGPMYKSFGNSWAVPNGAWIIGRIAQHQEQAA